MSEHENREQVTRRDFIRKSAEIAGGAALTSSILTLGSEVISTTAEAAPKTCQAIEAEGAAKTLRAEEISFVHQPVAADGERMPASGETQRFAKRTTPD